MVLSTLVNGAQPLRGVAYFALLAEPFAIVLALLIDPPDGRGRKVLLGTCGVLVAVQVPPLPTGRRILWAGEIRCKERSMGQERVRM